MPALWTTAGPGKADMAWEQGQGKEQSKLEGPKARAAVESPWLVQDTKLGRKQQIRGQGRLGAMTIPGPAQLGWGQSYPIVTTMCLRSQLPSTFSQGCPPGLGGKGWYSTWEMDNWASRWPARGLFRSSP